MKKMPEKYIPILILIFLLLLTWAEESIIIEGYFSSYLHLDAHKFLRFFIRGTYSILIFGFGYLGLSRLSAKWVRILWLYFYVIVVIAGGLRFIFEIYFRNYLNMNVWSFLISIYYVSSTPFPYIFLLLMALIVNRKQDNL
jgi:hypothetical protein